MNFLSFSAPVQGMFQTPVLTYVYLALTGVVDGHSHRKRVVVVQSDGKFSSARVLQ